MYHDPNTARRIQFAEAQAAADRRRAQLAYFLEEAWHARNPEASEALEEWLTNE